VNRHFSTEVCKQTSIIRLIALAYLFLPSLSHAQAPPYYTISTIAGTGATAGYSGDGGAATSADLNGPFDVVLDTSGNFYISDSANSRVRKVAGGNISTIAGNGTAGYSGNNGSPTSAELNSPAGLAFDSSSNLYIADGGNYVVWKITGGTINVVAGSNTAGAGFSGDLGPATGAQLSTPSGVVLDSSGNLYISDSGNNVVREVCAKTCPAWGGTAGEMNTYAGYFSAGPGYAGDGKQADRAELQNPNGLAIDGAGNLYIADSDNHVIRKVAAATGIITTVAGNGSPTSPLNPLGDGGPATVASLDEPKGVAVDANGYIYIADTDNCLIRVVEPNGIITTIAGYGSPGWTGDGGAALAAQLTFPSGVAVSNGKIYVADNGNQVIRLLTPIAVVPKIGAGGVVTASAFGASSSVAPGSWIEIYGSNLAATTTQWTSANFNGADAPTNLGGVTVTVGGLPAYIDYVSAGQVNVEVPSGVPAGPQPLILSTASGTSPAYSVTVNTTEPGFWAPPNFKIAGSQYVGAQSSDFKSYILPTGAVSGLSSQPASPGDTIILYGVGFGTVTPSTPAGQIVSGQTALTSKLEISIGGAPATISYAGLAPNYVGLYQFDVVVPTVPAGNAVPVTFTLGGVSGTQTLYTAIGN
jgi:uncharacterized protein (TIGR03437 family)